MCVSGESGTTCSQPAQASTPSPRRGRGRTWDERIEQVHLQLKPRLCPCNCAPQTHKFPDQRTRSTKLVSSSVVQPSKSQWWLHRTHATGGGRSLWDTAKGWYSLWWVSNVICGLACRLTFSWFYCSLDLCVCFGVCLWPLGPCGRGHYTIYGIALLQAYYTIFGITGCGHHDGRCPLTFVASRKS